MTCKSIHKHTKLVNSIKHAPPEHALPGGILPSLTEYLTAVKTAPLMVRTTCGYEVIEVNSIGAENRSLDIPETLIRPKGHGRSRTDDFKEVVKFGNSGRTLVVRNVPPALQSHNLAHDDPIIAHVRHAT